MSPVRRAPAGPRRRGVRCKALAAVLASTVLAACAGPGSLLESSRPAPLPPSVELASTPFHPQADQQCGPAALATVLGAAGHPAPAETLEREIFVPGREGSLQPELVGAIRARDLLPYELDGGLGAAGAVAFGGVGAIVVTAIWAVIFPELRRARTFDTSYLTRTPTQEPAT